MSLLERLQRSLEDSPLVRFGEYEYFIHPLTDGIPPAEPELVKEVLDALLRIGNFDCDKIVTAESMGFPLAALLSLRTGKPYVFVRKRKYGLPGEISVRQVTGYSKTNLYMNYVEEGDRVVIVDDVLSTGGTLLAISEALHQVGASIVDVLVVFDRMGSKRSLEESLGIPVKALLQVDLVDGKVVGRPSPPPI